MDTVVVVSTRNKLGYLQMALPQAHRFAGYSADWIVIDDGSSDGTWEWLSGYCYGRGGNMIAVRNHQAVGISGNKNFGLSRAKAAAYEWLVFLDDDLLMSPFWLQRLRAAATVTGDATLYSPIVLNDKTMLQKVKTLGCQDAWIVDGLGGACCMVPKAAFDIPWDERPVYQYEDAAYHSACVNAGFQLMVLGTVSAVHLPWIVMLDPVAERAKLRVRHRAVTGSNVGADQSFERQYRSVLNPWILSIGEAE